MFLPAEPSHQPCSIDSSYVFQFLVSHTGSGVCPCDCVSSQLKVDVSITVCLKSGPGLLLCPRLVAWVEEKLGPKLAGLGLNIVSQCLAITLWGELLAPAPKLTNVSQAATRAGLFSSVPEPQVGGRLGVWFPVCFMVDRQAAWVRCYVVSSVWLDPSLGSGWRQTV